MTDTLALPDTTEALVQLLVERSSSPYPIYERMRELGHIHAAHGGYMLLSREDVLHVLRDNRCGNRYSAQLRRLFGDEVVEGSRLLQSRTKWMLFTDPPVHTRLRGLVAKVFTRPALEGRAPRVQAFVDEHLERACEGGELDVVMDFAHPVTVDTIGDLMGVPRPERARFRQWGPVLDALPGSETYEEAERLLEEYEDYFAALIEKKRRDPGDDLLSELIHVEERGDRLSADELLALSLTLYGAGFDTTRQLIGNAVNALLDHPAELDLLQSDPDALMANALEEFLRYDPPVHLTTRTVLEEIEIGGRSFQPGDWLILNLAAANRDPEACDHADVLDLRRRNPRPVTFGGGVHHCVAAPLARLEARLALTALLKRCHDLRRAGDPVWEPLLVQHGIQNLPVAFG